MPALIGRNRALLGVASWAIKPASTDIDLGYRRLASNGRPRPFDAFMAYNAGSGFSRASAAYDQRLADPLVIDPYATDAARLRGDGLLIGPAATRVSTYPQNPQIWANSGATLTNVAADGQWSPVDVASAGASGNGIKIGSASSYALTSGVPVSIICLYKAGTSGRVRVECYNTTTTNVSRARGVVGAAAIDTTAAGSITNLSETAVAGGWYLGALTFMPNGTANHNILWGPDSATVGQTIRVYGGQVTATPYPREWILGTAGSTQVVAQDVLRWTPAQLGLVASQGALILRTTILGVDPSANGRLLEVGQADLTKGRISFLMQSNGYPSIVVTDETNTAVAFAQTAAAITAPTDITMSIAWGGGSCSMKLGSAALVTDASAASPAALTTFTLGSRADNSVPSFTRMRRLDVLAQRPSDADLAAIHDRIRLAA